MATQTGGETLLFSDAEARRYTSSLAFDWTILVLSLWLVAGSALDAWAHSHIPRLETFFTPWHAVLYSGFLAVATGVWVGILRNRMKGASWQNAIPLGYGLTALGTILFALGGIGDMIWHILFGIEKTIDALLSPTHLLLGISAVLIVTGPLRAAWYRIDDRQGSWKQLAPAMLSLGLFFTVLTYFTEYAHPFIQRWAFSNPASNSQLVFYAPAMGVEGILIQTGILMGVLLFAIRRWQLPHGACTAIFLLNVAVMLCFSHGPLYGLPVALLGGLVADVLLAVLRPSEQRQGAFRLFALLLPILFYLLYFLTLGILGGIQGLHITWSIHLWLGSTCIAGIVGLLLSYLAIPPARPQIVQE